MEGRIFINYRRGDDPGFTTALYMYLESEFGADRLFMDIEGHIRPGDDYVKVLNDQVAQCDVLLAIIGPRWSDLLVARADDPGDFVVIEIRAALEGSKRVIPVLVGGASFPRSHSLPDDIRLLARRNAVGLRPERFKADCQGLTNALKAALAEAKSDREARSETERKAADDAKRKRETEEAVRAELIERNAREQVLAGVTPGEIRKVEELANWRFIEDRDDRNELRDHLARFPEGVTERYALSKLATLEWKALGNSPSIKELRDFLDEFPKDEHAEASRQRLALLERVEQEHRVAEDRRQREDVAWANVAASQDAAVIEAFLSSWPKGQHTRAANRRLRELRGELTASGESNVFAFGAAGNSIILYSIIVFSALTPSANLVFDKVILNVILVSGAEWTLSVGDLIKIITLVMFFRDYVTTLYRYNSVYERIQSIINFVICLLAWMFVSAAATSTFFFISFVASFSMIRAFLHKPAWRSA